MEIISPERKEIKPTSGFGVSFKAKLFIDGRGRGKVDLPKLFVKEMLERGMKSRDMFRLEYLDGQIVLTKF